MKQGQIILLTVLTLALATPEFAAAQGSAFTYHGQLTHHGNPADGEFTMRFGLFDSLSNGTQIASQELAHVAVSEGTFDVTLSFGENAFDGNARWLEISVRDQAGQYNVLTPRQQFMPTPYAIMANTASNLLGTLPASQLTGTISPAQLGGLYSAPVSFNNAANNFAGNGGGLTNLNATTLDGFSAGNFWGLNGNAGAIAGVNFLGTTDDQPLELKVNGIRALRLEPATNGTPNIIGGSVSNLVSTDSAGATISGGDQNSIGSNTRFATIAGGVGNKASATSATVGGGDSNEAAGPLSTIGGGYLNSIAGDVTPLNSISGGASNSISDSDWVTASSIGGGLGNGITRRSMSSVIAGGRDNQIAYSAYSTVGGGFNNSVDGHSATIGGGYQNSMEYQSSASTIGGGRGNSVGFVSTHSTIGGGYSNRIDSDVSCAVIPGGAQARASSYGQMTHASGQFANAGDAQTSSLVCRGTTTAAEETELYLDGTFKRIVVPANATWGFDILVTARATAGSSAVYQIRGAIKSDGSSTSLIGTPAVTVLGADVSGWMVTAAADAAHGALVVKVTGADATTIRWVASVRTAEVSF